MNTFLLFDKTMLLLCFLTILPMLNGCKKETKKEQPEKIIDTETQDTDSQTQQDPPKTKFYAEDQDETVFNQDIVLTYHVTIDEADLERLEEHGNEEEYVKASLRVQGENVDIFFDEVGYRYKGAYSLHHCWDHFGGKRSYQGNCARFSRKLNFQKFNDSNRLFGLKRLNLHSMMSDQSKLRERLGYKLFNQYDVTTSRTAHAAVYVNGKFDGLFIAVEQIDGRFTAMRYPNRGNGNLYKEIWPRKNLNYDHVASHLRSNRSMMNNPFVHDFIEFGNIMENSTEENFIENSKGLIDLEHMLRYIVVDRTILNWDGIMAFYSRTTPHNFYWYHNDDEDRLFYLVPWDLDNTFWEFDMYMNPQQWCTANPIPDWNQVPLDCAQRRGCNAKDGSLLTPPHCDPLLRNLALTSWDRFYELGKEFIENIYVYENIEENLDKWAQQIEPYIEMDPLVDLAQWQQNVIGLKQIIKNTSWSFSKYLEKGITEEKFFEPLEESLLNDEIPFGGLRDNQINNFEFDLTQNSLDDFSAHLITTNVSNGTTLQSSLNTDEPLSGNVDLAFEVEFTKIPGQWNEWASLQLLTHDRESFDISEYSQLWLMASSDIIRDLRIDFRSNSYVELWRGIWPNFSFTINIGPEPAFYSIPLDNLSYPLWAKNAWQSTQGWDYADGQALEELKKSWTGLTFTLTPITDPSGYMISESETASVRIDNIYFTKP